MTATKRTPKRTAGPTKKPSQQRRKRRKWIVIREAWPKVRKRPQPDGSFVFEGDARLQGAEGKMEGSRKHFHDADVATAWAERMAAKRKSTGTSGLSLSASQQNDAMEAFRLARERGLQITLTEIVRAYVKHLGKVKDKITVADLVKRLLDYKKNNPKRPLSQRHLDDLRHRLGAFSKSFKDRLAHEVGASEIDAWLIAMPHSSTTKKKYRTLLNLLFGYGMKLGVVGENPIDHVEEFGIDEPKRGILTLAQARRLIDSADVSIVPALAVGLFAGLRPESELCKLDWCDIHATKETITDAEGNEKKSHGFIDLQHSKGASGQRMVAISANLYDWLIKYRPAGGKGPLCMGYDRFHTLLKSAATTAGITSWPHDGMRHSFATYHFGAYRDEGKTMAQTGHRSITTFRRHYRRPMSQKEAFEYWKIIPEKDPENIINLSAVE